MRRERRVDRLPPHNEVEDRRRILRRCAQSRGAGCRCRPIRDRCMATVRYTLRTFAPAVGCASRWTPSRATRSQAAKTQAQASGSPSRRADACTRRRRDGVAGGGGGCGAVAEQGRRSSERDGRFVRARCDESERGECRDGSAGAGAVCVMGDRLVGGSIFEKFWVFDGPGRERPAMVICRRSRDQMPLLRQPVRPRHTSPYPGKGHVSMDIASCSDEHGGRQQVVCPVAASWTSGDRHCSKQYYADFANLLIALAFRPKSAS